MFLHLSVILSICLSACCDTSPGGHPPPSACWDTHTLPSACWDRHDYCCGWYASYWNAFLFDCTSYSFFVNFEKKVFSKINCKSTLKVLHLIRTSSSYGPFSVTCKEPESFTTPLIMSRPSQLAGGHTIPPLLFRYILSFEWIIKVTVCW